MILLKYRRIQDLREDHEWSQEKVGQMIQVSQRTYAYYESGEHMIPPETLSALANIYGVSVDYLLERTNIQAPYPKK